jgi:hypothetical protein
VSFRFINASYARISIRGERVYVISLGEAGHLHSLAGRFSDLV